MIKDACNILLSIIFVCQESANMKVEEVEVDTLLCRYEFLMLFYLPLLVRATD